MKKEQKSFLLMSLHSLPKNERQTRLNLEIKNFGIAENELQEEIANIEDVFNSGIAKLNRNQLTNLTEFVRRNGLKDIKRRLSFFEIAEDYHNNIIEFFQEYIQTEEPIDVGDLDPAFKGVQVATRDNFNTIINQGYTGDWVVKPENIIPRKVQIASMNDSGLFPRGYYINADITDIKAIPYGKQIRHRLFIANPVIINAGNRNVKFNLNPVKYI